MEKAAQVPASLTKLAESSGITIEEIFRNISDMYGCDVAIGKQQGTNKPLVVITQRTNQGIDLPDPDDIGLSPEDVVLVPFIEDTEEEVIPVQPTDEKETE